MIAYHVTGRRNRESILRDGLRLSDPMTGDQFAGRAPCHLWLFVSEDIARDAAARGRWGADPQNDVWVCDVTGYTLLPDHHDGWGSTRPGWDDAARVVTVAIPPDRIRLLDAMADLT